MLLNKDQTTRNPFHLLIDIWLSDAQYADHHPSDIGRLMLTFFPKEKYVIDYHLLKYVLILGKELDRTLNMQGPPSIQLQKVHQVVRYEQRAFMADYIKQNIERRTRAKNDCEKDFFKLMNNSIFGKTMEVVRKRIAVEMLGSEEEMDKKRLNLKDFGIFNENLVGALYNRSTITLSKPIFVGFSILDLSKLHMLRFHYDTILKLPNIQHHQVNLMFTDTDSYATNMWIMIFMHIY